jgi:hypothetical protein
MHAGSFSTSDRLRDVVVEAGTERLERRALVRGLNEKNQRDLEIARAHIGDRHTRFVAVFDQDDINRRGTRLQIGVFQHVGERHTFDRRLETVHRCAQLFEVACKANAHRRDTWQERSRGWRSRRGGGCGCRRCG